MWRDLERECVWREWERRFVKEFLAENTVVRGQESVTNFAVFHHMLQHLYVKKGVREKIDDRGDAIAYEINLI